MKLLKVLIVLLFPMIIVFAQDSTQTFLSLNSTGVEEFLQKYPKYDGRGTIVLVLDTGIDMGIDGLKKTSTGKVKVIDVQDFTGQGNINFYPAEIEEDDSTSYFINEEHNYKVNGADKLKLKAWNDKYFIGLLPEELWKNSGSGASDINGNGKKNDKFFFVVFQTDNNKEKYWVMYIDANSNGDVSDEKPLRNYKVNYDTFTIPNKKGLPYFTIAVNIFPDKKLVSFFFDDGSHGTHCSGIATGYHIDGSGDFNGVAPGAQLMGLKLGNNNYAGGSTVTESMKKAYLYADKVSKERKEPCIINMSFGVGSEIEGRADIEKFLENLVKDNPYLYISTSNGNEGPGISTTGMPASTSAVFSSGAVLTKEVGRDLYNATLDTNIILHFSSRGGEVPKPDVVSPGACTSTVPNFSRGDRFWGTSMASPYSAGVMSLLLSAAKVEFPHVKIPSRLLYKAMREGAVKMKGYDYVDQGGGYINVMNAWKLLKKYIKEGEIKKFETYTIKSFAPNMPGNSAPSLYIRDGSYITGNETFNFNIKRNNTINSKKFFRSYRIKSEAKWLKPVKRKTYIRNNQSANIAVRIDKSKLTEPGLYNGRIRVSRADRTHFPEFDLMATVVIPYKFNLENNYQTSWNNLKLKPGELKRYFIKIPAGATSMTVNFSSNPNQFCFAWYFLHDPDGRQIARAVLNSDSEVNSIEKNYYNLTPGVYELDVLGLFIANNLSTCNLSVKFGGIELVSNNVLDKDHTRLNFINQIEKPETFNVSGEILGTETDYVIHLDSTDTYEIPFTLTNDEASESFEVSVSKEDFNKTTDFALMIYDNKGKSRALGGLSYYKETISINNKFNADTSHYKLVLKPAFANKPGQMTIFVKEHSKFVNPEPISVKHNFRSRINMYPSILTDLNCSYGPLPKVNANEKIYGKIYFNLPQKDETEFEFPIYIKN